MLEFFGIILTILAGYIGFCLAPAALIIGIIKYAVWQKAKIAMPVFWRYDLVSGLAPPLLWIFLVAVGWHFYGKSLSNIIEVAIFGYISAILLILRFVLPLWIKRLQPKHAAIGTMIAIIVITLLITEFMPGLPE